MRGSWLNLAAKWTRVAPVWWELMDEGVSENFLVEKIPMFRQNREM
jgi:hypothetical protein